MSDETKDLEEGPPRRAESARQLVSAAGLLVAVLAILGLGAVLAVDPGTEPVKVASTKVEPPRSVPTPAQPPVVSDETPEPVEEPATAPPQGLAARAASDSRRLARGGGTFTLQLLVACKEETVERYLHRAAGSPSLYLLPASVKGQSCFRVSFGSYASQREAAAAVGTVPAGLRSGVGVPAPKRIADLLL